MRSYEGGLEERRVKFANALTAGIGEVDANVRDSLTASTSGRSRCSELRIWVWYMVQITRRYLRKTVGHYRPPSIPKVSLRAGQSLLGRSRMIGVRIGIVRA
jgi:hypothetical protein